MLLLPLLLLLFGGGVAKDNGLARTPPMGWLSWERYRCETDCETFPDSCVNENLYMAMADLMVSEGYHAAGYQYVHIDDCWAHSQRDSQGRLQPDPARFPNGIKGVADYVHKRGLKLGIYTDIGYATCQKFPGSKFYMQSDAKSFADWGVDLVKIDGCNTNKYDSKYAFPTFSFFLNQTGRPMVMNCNWPAPQPNFTAIRETCNMWRVYSDVQDSWEVVRSIMDQYGRNPHNFSSFTGPGGFADADQLVVGDFGLSYPQQKAQFGMWAMFSAPLFMSVDLRSISEQSKAILLHRDVIAINQDPRGAQAIMLYGFPNSVSVWLKPLFVKDTHAIAFLNYDNRGRPTPFSIHLGDIGLTNQNGYNVTDVFDRRPMGVYKLSSDLKVVIDPTGIVLLKLVPV